MGDKHFVSKDNITAIMSEIADIIKELGNACAVNLLPIKSGTRVSNGVHWTVNADDTVDIYTDAGGATEDSVQELMLQSDKLTIPDGTYTISINPTTGVRIWAFCSDKSTGSGISTYVDTSSHRTFTKSNGDTYYTRVALRVLSGTIITTPVKIKPMLEAGEVAHDFVQYSRTPEFGSRINNLTKALNSKIESLESTVSSNYDNSVWYNNTAQSDANSVRTTGVKVVVSYYNDNTLNTPFKQGIASSGLGAIITFNHSEWISQVCMPVSDTSVYIRGKAHSSYGGAWTPWYKTAKIMVTDTEPTAGAAAPYPNDTLIAVYE